MESLKFQIINPIHFEGWDDQIVTLPGYSFFHSSAWAKVLSASYGYEPQYLVWLSGDRIAGLIPMMDVKSRLTGHRGVSLPFTDFCDPIIDTIIPFSEIFKQIVNLGSRNRWKYIDLRGGQEHFENTIPSRNYLTHTMCLSGDSDRVMASFRDSTRRNIKKAQHAGVAVRLLSSSEAVQEFYRLNCSTRKRHGLPPQPYRFFKELQEHVLEKNLGFVALAEYRNKAIAGNIFLHLGDKAVYKYGASDDLFSDLRANNMVMWEAIKWYCQNGYKELHLGRTDCVHRGLQQFKNGWGVQEKHLAYYKYDVVQSRFTKARPGVISISEKVVSRLPSRALRLTGSLLYRHFA